MPHEPFYERKINTEKCWAISLKLIYCREISHNVLLLMVKITVHLQWIQNCILTVKITMPCYILRKTFIKIDFWSIYKKKLNVSLKKKYKQICLKLLIEEMITKIPIK